MAFLLAILIYLLISCSPPPKITLEPTSPWIEPTAQEEPTYNSVPVSILDRLIQSESSWQVRSESRSKHEHSVGLAQVNLKWLPFFQEKYGLQDPWKPSQAIDFASRYLRDLYLQTGSWYKAVLAYKCGLSGIHKAPKKIQTISWWVAYGNNPPNILD